MKDKKDITVTNAIQKMLDESNPKPNKIWVNKGSEFYNSSNIEMYLTQNEGNSVVAATFITTLKNKIFK